MCERGHWDGFRVTNKHRSPFRLRFCWSIHPLDFRSSPTVFCQILLSSSSLHHILLFPLLSSLWHSLRGGKMESSVCLSQWKVISRWGGEGRTRGRTPQGNYEHISLKNGFKKQRLSWSITYNSYNTFSRSKNNLYLRPLKDFSRKKGVILWLKL